MKLSKDTLTFKTMEAYFKAHHPENWKMHICAFYFGQLTDYERAEVIRKAKARDALKSNEKGRARV